MAPNTVDVASSSLTHSSIPSLISSACRCRIEENIASATNSIASSMLDADLHPVDSELILEIRAMFLTHWGMNSTQTDARMVHFNYANAVAALPQHVPGAIGSTFCGGTYAGIIRGVNGAPDQHLVLLDGEADTVTWGAAGSWAASQGCELLTRAEQRLLQANLPNQFKPDWYWSGEQYGPSSSTACYQGFYDGHQTTNHRSYEGRARAVRRFPI